MTTIRNAAADLHARWTERDRRYAMARLSPDARLVHGLRADELDELEAAAADAGLLTDLHRSGAWRELRTMLDGWRP